MTTTKNKDNMYNTNIFIQQIDVYLRLLLYLTQFHKGYKSIAAMYTQ